MATITAHALLGKTHPYDGGITNVSHQLWLTENSIARWDLMLAGDPKQAIRWIPHPKSMLEDGFLMVGLFVLSDQELVAEAERLLGPLGEVDMIPDDLKIRERLHTVNRKLMPDLKIALTIYEGSTLSQQFSVLDMYSGWDAEICLSHKRREKPRSGWFVSNT